MYFLIRKAGIAMTAMVMIAGALSCSKYAAVPDPYCEAGSDGSLEIILKPEHHGEPIPGLPNYPDSAWIKYNTNEYPGDVSALYDRIVTGSAGSDSVVVTGLSCGYYYIYMTGFDTSIAQRVRGGIPVYIEPGDDGRTITIPVTED
jgi:hypothetical protein